MKFKELKAKNIKELESMLEKSREDLQTLKFKVAAKQTKDVREIRAVKKIIAKILTLKSQNKNQIKKEEK